LTDSNSPYIVSSLKYRPQVFEDVIGQDHVSRTLRNAILRERLANGYLFTGPRGVGKTTSARILAKALNCENPKDGNPCNACTHCHEITGGRSLDVLEVDGASTRGIDAIRELREVVKYPPSNSRYRIYIIDEVHMLTKEAFNALLKTLEEPPPQVLFIFATTEPQKVPLTILSRCQRYDFRRIPIELMVNHLKKVASGEGVGIQVDALHLIAQKAGGSLRDSLSLLDQVAAYAEGDVDVELARDVLGILDQSIYLKVLSFVINQDSKGLIEYVSGLIEQGIGISEFIDGLAEHVRNLLVTCVAGSTDLLETTENEAAALQEQVTHFEERDLLRLQNLLQRTIREMRFQSNQTVALELLLLKMTHFTRALQLDAIAAGTPQRKPAVPSKQPEPASKRAVAAKPTSAPVPPSAKPQEIKASEKPEDHKETSESQSVEPIASSPLTNEPSHLSVEAITKKWEALITAVNKERTSLANFLKEGQVQQVKDNRVEIHFAKEHGFQVEQLELSRGWLERIFATVLGKQVRLAFVKNSDQKPKTEQEDRVLAHPASQHALNIFDGEIMDD